MDVDSEYLNTSTTIDWLAFTVKLSDFRHCTKSAPFSGIAFPDVPELPAMRPSSGQDLEDINEYRCRVYSSYFEKCVLIFLTRVLGFTVGCLIESKFNFYDNHFNIYSADGLEFCGKVGWAALIKEIRSTFLSMLKVVNTFSLSALVNTFTTGCQMYKKKTIELHKSSSIVCYTFKCISIVRRKV